MTLLEQEIVTRINQYLVDTDYLTDNPNRDLRKDALADIVEMGSDYAGAYPDASDVGNRNWRAWRRLHSQALYSLTHTH